MTLGLPGVGAVDVLEKTLKEERKRYYKDGMWLGVEARMGPNSVVYAPPPHDFVELSFLKLHP